MKQRDTFQARVEALERQLKIAEHDSVHQSQLYSEYIEEWTKERDTLQKRVAELEERLIVMCVAQLNQWSDGLSEIKSLVAGDYFGAWDSVEASNPRRNRILDLCDGLLGNIPSRPSPDPPDPAPLKEGEVQSIDHLDSIGED